MEGKGRGTAAGQDRAGSAVYGTRGKGTEGQKNKGKEENGTEDRRTKEQKKGQETYSYLPFLMPPTSSLFSMVISVFFTEALSLPKR